MRRAYAGRIHIHDRSAFVGPLQVRALYLTPPVDVPMRPITAARPGTEHHAKSPLRFRLQGSPTRAASTNKSLISPVILARGQSVAMIRRGQKENSPVVKSIPCSARRSLNAAGQRLGRTQKATIRLRGSHPANYDQNWRPAITSPATLSSSLGTRRIARN